VALGSLVSVGAKVALGSLVSVGAMVELGSMVIVAAIVALGSGDEVTASVGLAVLEAPPQALRANRTSRHKNERTKHINPPLACKWLDERTNRAATKWPPMELRTAGLTVKRM